MTELRTGELAAKAMAARKFGRDVLVNVLANLIAGLILYLLGAFVGLFPSPQAAVVWAATSLGGLTAGVLTGTVIRRSGEWGRTGLVGLLSAGAVFFILNALVFPRQYQPWWLTLGMIVVAVVLIVGAVATASGEKRGAAPLSED